MYKRPAISWGDGTPALARGQILYGHADGTTQVLSAGTSGQVLTSDGTDVSYGDAFTGNTTAGGVGTYSLLGKADGSTTALGASVAGSLLRYASTYSRDPTLHGMSGTAPSGTWQAMSIGGSYAGSTLAAKSTTVTLFLRIS